MNKVDGALFTFAGVSALWLAYLLLREGFRPGWPSLLLVIFWVLFSYLLLPRLHRILTRLYVPGYFIGRTRTSDGLLGDPVNLALLGSEQQIHRAMTSAAWVRADDLSPTTGRKIVTSTLRRRSYAQAPVSPLHLFDRQQDFAYQQEVAGSPSKRHHVRFWRCPPGWMLPGGYRADWLAAGTYDRSAGLSLFTFQVTHKIEANTDVERDFIVDSLLSADAGISISTIKDFSTGYHARNGGGDLIETDGDLPIIDLRQVSAGEEAPSEPTDSREKRPAQITFGAGVALVRGTFFLLMAVLLALLPAVRAQQLLEGSVDTGQVDLRDALIASAVVLAVFGVVELGLSLAVLSGRNWARLLLMTSAVATTLTAFVRNARGTTLITLTNLPTVATGILVLLALSSHRARDYATRRRHVPKRIADRPGKRRWSEKS